MFVLALLQTAINCQTYMYNPHVGGQSSTQNLAHFSYNVTHRNDHIMLMTCCVVNKYLIFDNYFVYGVGVIFKLYKIDLNVCYTELHHLTRESCD